uniref:Uncharacterized protein n=1 Tax=Leersia perrieri TaxID=77586 RepID=A0A0D9WF28_9ORYZ
MSSSSSSHHRPVLPYLAVEVEHGNQKSRSAIFLSATTAESEAAALLRRNRYSTGRCSAPPRWAGSSSVNQHHVPAATATAT